MENTDALSDNDDDELELDDDTGDDTELLAVEIEHRHWLEAIVSVLKRVSPLEHKNPRVQKKLDDVMIAACDRMVAILNSDSPTEWRDYGCTS